MIYHSLRAMKISMNHLRQKAEYQLQIQGCQWCDMCYPRLQLIQVAEISNSSWIHMDSVDGSRVLPNCFNHYWLVVEPTPLKHDGVRHWGWWHCQYDGKKKHVPNQQPDYFKHHFSWLNTAFSHLCLQQLLIWSRVPGIMPRLGIDLKLSPIWDGSQLIAA